MSLLTNTTEHEASILTDQPEASIKSAKADELVIKMKSSIHHPSAMSDDLKKAKSMEGQRLNELFDETLSQKIQTEEVNCHWTDDSTVEVEGLSKLTLHNFILKAEELGKNVTYTRTYTVKVSD